VISHTALQLALRARLLTLSLATTGSVSLSATATGYARTTGSFYADGFWPGQELATAGFASNGTRVITQVTPTMLTVSSPITPEAAAAGRTLSVGLPSSRAWENVTFTPVTGVPWVEEQYIPGPTVQSTMGPNGLLIAEPMVAVLTHCASDTGLTAARYADAVLTLFAPRQSIPLTNGDVLRVRGDVGPFVGQLQQSQPGFAVKPVTIPCRVYTPNSI
jgi:hypothetical protein